MANNQKKKIHMNNIWSTTIVLHHPFHHPYSKYSTLTFITKEQINKIYQYGVGVYSTVYYCIICHVYVTWVNFIKG